MSEKVNYQETFAGAACQHTLSLANQMFQRHLFNLVQSKAAPLQSDSNS
jgi:hypothetical protein